MVGAGWIAKDHAAALTKFEGVELRTIAERARKKVLRAERRRLLNKPSVWLRRLRLHRLHRHLQAEAKKNPRKRRKNPKSPMSSRK